MEMIARVKWFDASQGFGFIEDDGGDVFVHRSEVSGAHDSLRAGDLVAFELRGGPRGRAACHVRLMETACAAPATLTVTASS